jgi:hypothetical protein
VWTYNSANGNLSRDGSLVGTGYSGNHAGLNNPAMDNVHDVGPIPKGSWIIGKFFDDPGGKGPIVAHLSPNADTTTFGRSGFMIHGDNREGNHTASEGCIILPHDVRAAIEASGDYELEVA